MIIHAAAVAVSPATDEVLYSYDVVLLHMCGALMMPMAILLQQPTAALPTAISGHCVTTR